MRTRVRGGFTEDMAINGTPGEQRCMALFMNVHPPDVPATVDDAADAHTADMAGIPSCLPDASHADTTLDRSGILGVLQRLSPDHRQILLDAGVRRHTENVIAARLDLPVGTVRSRLHYAMGELRRELTAHRLLWSGE